MKFTTFAFLCLAALSRAEASTQVRYTESADELKVQYEEAIRRHDTEGAWRLFCKAPTSDEIITMYRRTVTDTINLPVASVALAPLQKKSSSIPHSIEPIGRLVFTYDMEKQEEPKRASSFFYYGRAGGKYCLGLPVVPPEA
jgi:invasion protein IalB